MRRIVALAMTVTTGLAVAAGTSGATPRPAPKEARIPTAPRDVGAGENLILVVGGVFDSRAAAAAAAATMPFGDVQGYYVASVAQFRGLGRLLGVDAPDHVLVTGFRTLAGARDFLELARAAGAPALLTPRLRNLGPEFVGLGQEAAPDHSGPLQEAIPASRP